MGSYLNNGAKASKKKPSATVQVVGTQPPPGGNDDDEEEEEEYTGPMPLAKPEGWVRPYVPIRELAEELAHRQEEIQQASAQSAGTVSFAWVRRVSE